MAGLICAGAVATSEFSRDHLMDCWQDTGAALVGAEEGGVERIFRAMEGNPLFLFGYNNIR